ncbi:MAG: hypothetical protein ACREQY_15530, partial [Candidatus Binatia bacterium]
MKGTTAATRKYQGLAIVAAILLASCSMQTQPTPAAAVVNKTYDISCDDAHRYAAKTLQVRDLTITEVERGPTGGRVKGKSEKEETEVRIACGPQGVTVSSSGGTWLEQGIRMSFANFVAAGDRIWPVPKGPKIFLEQLEGPEAKLEFPGELEPLGLTAIRVRALNGGTRSVRIEPSRIVGRGEAGGESRTISAAGVKEKLAADPKIDEKILRPTTLAQSEEVRGFVFLPAGHYTSAVVKLVDVET